MMNRIFVAWQQPDSREWIPVAKLEYSNGIYAFSYTQGIFRAKEFRQFSGMSKVDVVYESPRLFPLFANRVISKSRPEFKDYLRWLGLSDMEEDPMAILSLTGGIRGTDSIELFQPPTVTDEGVYKLEFFARSLSHLPSFAIDRIATMERGELICLMKDMQNDFDPQAVAMRTGTPSVFLGYCPKYYAQDLGTLLSSPECDLTVKVKCVNLDAPSNMRLLCSVTATVPKDFSPLNKERDFLPVVGIPAEWSQLTTSLDAMLQG
jgi:hypothetical protein